MWPEQTAPEPKLTSVPLDRMAVSFDYRWKPVLDRDGHHYLFPRPIDALNAEDAERPAVYRWVVFREQPGDLKRLYVGEAEVLSRRIRGYINPGATQKTNIRMKAEFEKEIEAGKGVTLQTLYFEPFELNGVRLEMGMLGDKRVRRLLEGLFVVYYSQLGYAVLNA